MSDWPSIARQIAVEEGHPWPDMFVRQINQESSFADDVIYCQRASSAGALGIAQFMPGTAAGLGINPCDPMAALHGAARLMVGYYNRYGRWDYALAAYNAGSGNVDRYGGVPPFAKTQRYVANILGGSSEASPSPASEVATPFGGGGGILVLVGAVFVLWVMLG